MESMIPLIFIVGFSFLGYMLFQGKEEPANNEVNIFDAIDNYVGLHIMDSGSDMHDYYKSLPASEEVSDIIKDLDFENNDYFITIIPVRGEQLSIDVHLGEEYVIKSTYSNITNISEKIYMVASPPLQSKCDLIKLIKLFILKDDSWIHTFDFK